MQMELRGVPAVTLTSAVFRPLAESEAEAFQMPELRVIDVPHPVATRPRDELEALGRGLVTQIIDALTNRAKND